MTPKEYADILQKIQLKKIVLHQLEATCDLINVKEGALSVALDDEPLNVPSEAQWEPLIAYTLRVDTQEGHEVLCIKATFKVVVDSSEVITDEFFELYKNNLRMTTLPFLREIVASLSGRMDLPTLTIPYIVFNAPLPGSDEGNSASKVHARSSKKKAVTSVAQRKAKASKG